MVSFLGSPALQRGQGVSHLQTGLRLVTCGTRVNPLALPYRAVHLVLARSFGPWRQPR